MSWDSHAVRRVVISIVTILLVWAALAVGQGRPGVDLSVGSQSPVEFTATSTVTVVDSEATSVAKQQARNEVEPQYQVDAEKSGEATANIEAVFVQVQEVALEAPPGAARGRASP